MASEPKPRVTRAVHANVGVENWYRRQLEAPVLDMTRDLRRVVRKDYPDGALVKDEAIVADAKRDTAADRLKRLREGLDAWGDRWTKRFDTLAETLAARFVSRAFEATQRSMQAAFKSAGFAVAFRPTPGSVAAYQAAIAENINLIRSIAPQYLKDVQSEVWASVMKGGDLHTLSVGLQQKYGVTFRRAALIARDQNNKAKAVIENVRRQELGITEAYWQHSGGGKEPRPTHVAMSGKRYKLTQGVYDSDEKAFVYPGELIKCRCTSRAVIPGFE